MWWTIVVRPMVSYDIYVHGLFADKDRARQYAEARGWSDDDAYDIDIVSVEPAQ